MWASLRLYIKGQSPLSSLPGMGVQWCVLDLLSRTLR